MLIELVQTAEAHRRDRFRSRVLDAWRVLNGPADGAPAGLVLDRYGGWLVLSAREGIGQETIERWAEAAIGALECDGLVLKILRRPASASESRVFRGTLPSEPLRIREEDATFLCSLNEGVSTGLYLDQRETRLAIRPYAQGVEVLNLFAYTGAFSVHAALGGARRVTSVDVSKKALRWARENMAASGLDPDRHRWFPDDVPKHLARAARREARYGLVIVDPPTFGHGRGVVSLERELDDLVGASVGVVDQGGVLVFAVHAREIDAARALLAVERAASVAKRRVQVLEQLGLPASDHPASDDADDRGAYLKTLVLKVG
jgi:23S rRNA (cytosine1962-C5)-methyltransferase